MALRGIKIVEFAGLAPVPFCGMILADFGASVLRVDQLGANTSQDVLGNGKKSIAVNLKDKAGVDIIKRICKNSDVVIEPFRPGVMERLGIGPKVLMADNAKLIYARLTGFGQSGPYSKRAGHDINYMALSGILSLFGRAHENPMFPANLAADMGGGGLMCALGILLALFERSKSGLGQVIDANMVEGTAYLGSWMYRSQSIPMIWGQKRGYNLLDSGAHFYEVYKTKDDKYMSVGAIEPQFYANLIECLQLSYDDAPRLENYEESKKLFATKFLEKTQEEWCKVFENVDACVAPVLSLSEAPEHAHNSTQGSFVKVEGDYAPKPAPRLSRTPGASNATERLPEVGEHTEGILKDLGYTQEEIQRLESNDVIETFKRSKL